MNEIKQVMVYGGKLVSTIGSMDIDKGLISAKEADNIDKLVEIAKFNTDWKISNSTLNLVVSAYYARYKENCKLCLKKFSIEKALKHALAWGITYFESDPVYPGITERDIAKNAMIDTYKMNEMNSKGLCYKLKHLIFG